MVVVLAIITALMTAGISLLSGTGAHSRRAATDTLIGLIEQARTTAINSRTHVVLAIAEPGDLPTGDERCRVGLFKVAWPHPTPSSVIINEAVLLTRWQTLNTGIALVPSTSTTSPPNPINLPQITINYGGTKTVVVHALTFNPRGGLHFPSGATPVVLQISEGAYRNGVATPNRRGANQTVSENVLKIGRSTARPYRIDP